MVPSVVLWEEGSLAENITKFYYLRRLELAETTPGIKFAKDIQQVRPMSSHNNISSKSSAKAQKKADARVQSTTQNVEKQADMSNSSKATGRWTREEHFRFLEALKIYGKEWKRV
jgi:hypothetical protein